LYELEAHLGKCSFFRASKALLINLQRVQSLRPELGARLLLTMDNKEKIVVSRQYAKTIKNALGVN
jgi:DNA-binding LytR/AlgR family response regulator